MLTGHAPTTLTPPLVVNRGRQATFIATVFLASRLLLAVTAITAWNHFGKAHQDGGHEPPPHGSLIRLFERADAAWYADVAKAGYHYHVDPATGEADGNIGFYPVYPMLVRAMRVVLPDVPTAGHLVASVMLLAACFLLWELALLELCSVRAANWTITFALFCPGSAWFTMVFSESTFLLLLVAVIWGCRRQHWLLAAGAGFLLALTRAIGVVAVVFVALEVWTDWHEHRRIGGGTANIPATGYLTRLLAIAGPLLGYLAFFVFLHWRFGDWHAQHKVMVSHWPVNAHLVTPWAAFAREWPQMHMSKRVVIYGLLTMGIILSALSLPALRRWSYPALAFALITMYVVATYHSPMARYLSVVVPLHLTLGWLAVSFRGLGWLMLAASAMLMIFITGAMVNGYIFY